MVDMKIRNGFVSNSSSTSFSCEICGRSESGWDAIPRDLGFVECPNGHVICEDDMLDDTEIGDRKEDEEGNYKEYDIEECGCPICNFVVLSNRDTARYLLKKFGHTREVVFESVKALNKRRKKLYDSEYVMYVCTKEGLNPQQILDEIKGQFKTYQEYQKSL